MRLTPMALLFLDTNIFLRHFLQDDSNQSPKASAFLKRIEEGLVKVRTSDTVIFETVFTLQKGYRRQKTIIRDGLLPLIELPGMVLPGKRRYRKVFSLYVEKNLPFADAYHAVLMEQLNLTEIVTFDTDFDHIKGITRIKL
jgi:predicted nucleic acid-binding protein